MRPVLPRESYMPLHLHVIGGCFALIVETLHGFVFLQLLVQVLPCWTIAVVEFLLQRFNTNLSFNSK